MSRKMGLKDLAWHTYQGLKTRGIPVTLSGGGCVSIFTENTYLSYDLDFIRSTGSDVARIAEAMGEMGFRKESRHYTHSKSDFYVEFPAPPLYVGNEPPKVVREYPLWKGDNIRRVRMLSPSDCVKDRLCAFFHWNDKQSLDQAVEVCKRQRVRIREIARWAEAEGMSDKFQEFLQAVSRMRKKGRAFA